MTTLAQSPVDEDLLSLLEDTASKPFAEHFRQACYRDALEHDGEVHPSRVNKMLRDALGAKFNPRALSAAWAPACSPDGFLDLTEQDAPIDRTVSKGNGNKGVALRRWRNFGGAQ